jgi:hypothetical protein
LAVFRCIGTIARQGGSSGAGEKQTSDAAQKGENNLNILPVLRIRDIYPGSRTWILIFTHPGSRIQGKKGTGFRIQIVTLYLYPPLTKNGDVFQIAAYPDPERYFILRRIQIHCRQNPHPDPTLR